MPQLPFYAKELPLTDGSYVYAVVEKRNAVVDILPPSGRASIAGKITCRLTGIATLVFTAAFALQQMIIIELGRL